MRDNLLSLDRAQTLIPAQWSIVERNGLYMVLTTKGARASSPSLRRALLSAGVAIPDPLWPFIATGLSVIRNGKHIAKAESATMASRIANALNAHKPDKRGR